MAKKMIKLKKVGRYTPPKPTVTAEVASPIEASSPKTVMTEQRRSGAAESRPKILQVAKRGPRTILRTSQPVVASPTSKKRPTRTKVPKTEAEIQLRIRDAYALLNGGGIALLNLPELIVLTSLSRSTIYRRIHDGLLPSPKRIGGRSLWKLDEVNAALK